MSNCYRLLFNPNLRSYRWILLATISVGFIAIPMETACAQQSSRAVSSRKPHVAEMASGSTVSKRPIQRAAAVENEAVDSVKQASCKNCQANAGGTVAHEHTSSDSNVLHESIEDNSDFGDVGCDGVSCTPWGISVADGCGNVCGIDPCSPLGLLSRRLYMRAEVASFWGSGQFLPQLISTSVGQPLPPIEEAGLSGDPDTRSLFGGREVVDDATVGIRYEVGLWMDDCKSRGFLVRLLDSGDHDVGFQMDGTRQAVIARNFLDVGPPSEQSIVSVAYPNQTSGSISANLSSNTNGGDLLLRQMLVQDHLVRLDWLMGYQTARISESLDIVSNTTDLTAAPNPRLDQEDHFRVRNQFHGATFGFGGEAREGCWYFGGLFKVGLGNMERRTDISGFSRTTVGTDVATQNQGLLARQTNIGTYRQETFVITPELGLHIGYRLTHQLDLTIGYSMLRLPKVARVTDALDRELASNVSDPLVGDLRPAFIARESNFTLHSVNLGLQWAY